MTVYSGSNVLVFTDLDGTLLDHKTYSFAKAKPALAMIKEKALDEIPFKRDDAGILF